MFAGGYLRCKRGYPPLAFRIMTLAPQRGFTLVELVITLVLVSILAVAVIINWPGAGLNLSAQADQLASDLRYTQFLAMTRGERYRMNFAADRYWISNRDATVTTLTPTGTTTVMLNNGIGLGSTSAFIVFDGNGAPYTTASLPGTALASDAVITLTAGADARTLRISPETGRVIVQ